MDKKTKKISIAIAIVTVLLILLVPEKQLVKDGGSVVYEAPLYSVTDYHTIRMGGAGYDTGIEVKILGITVYENTTFDQE